MHTEKRRGYWKRGVTVKKVHQMLNAKKNQWTRSTFKVFDFSQSPFITLLNLQPYQLSVQPSYFVSKTLSSFSSKLQVIDIRRLDTTQANKISLLETAASIFYVTSHASKYKQKAAWIQILSIHQCCHGKLKLDVLHAISDYTLFIEQSNSRTLHWLKSLASAAKSLSRLIIP